jgi:hypothetical protein
MNPKIPFTHMAIDERLFLHHKPDNRMLINGLYLLSSSRWLKKVATNFLK